MAGYHGSVKKGDYIWFSRPAAHISFVPGKYYMGRVTGVWSQDRWCGLLWVEIILENPTRTDKISILDMDVKRKATAKEIMEYTIRKEL